MKPGALLLAAATFLSGCLGAGLGPDSDARTLPGLSEPLWSGRLSEGLMLPSFDGTELSIQIFRPDVPEDVKVPIIVNFSPYWGNTAGTAASGGDNFSMWLLDEFVPRGYAVALASVRGTGASGGCFEMGGANEIEDTKLTVEWLAAQPWSNGKVGAIAKSYDGTVANMAAIAAPKGLATIVPVSGITEWYHYLHTGGLVYGAGPVNRGAFTDMYYLGVGWGVKALFEEGFLEDPVAYHLQGNSVLGPSQHPQDACPHLAEASAAALHTATTGEYTAYWQERNYLKDVGNAEASLFLIHGLQDWNVQPTHVGEWFNAYPGPKKAMLGQWDHLYPTRDDFLPVLLRWFDSELKGVDNGVWDEPAVEVQSDACVWRHEADWPPARATQLALHLAADGALAALPGEAASAAYTQGRERGLPLPADLPMGAPEAGLLGPDRLEFLSEPLAARTHMSGIGELTFTATSDRPLTAFTAVLYDVDADDARREVNWAFLSSAHRNGLDASEPLAPGESAEYVLRFYPQDTVFEAGHRIGLAIASHNIGTNPYVTTNMPATGATNTIELGGASRLALPVIAGESPLPVQPTMRPAMAYPYADWKSRPVQLACTPDED